MLVCSSQNFVAEFALHNYPVSESDILSKGAAAWNAALNTVNIGKFNLGCRKPVVDTGRCERVRREQVYALKGAYRMNE